MNKKKFKHENCHKKPELLAPAGNLQSAVTALDAGADAVYIGMKKFNARERAENFSSSDASKLINYAHSNGKKVYITINTLIKESEMLQAAELLSEIYELAPDSVIVQDIGLASVIRRFFPELIIHASTQMAIHNSAGIQTAEKIGISRVILERQITIEEIKKISSVSNMELEVFIQGALCCSLSGQCLFSSWIGGRSGNRGRCTQPCRRRFYSEKGNGFFFSPKDLASVNEIPELIKAGIASFKIEGRLKKPDYISSVISAYRMIIDVAPDVRQDALKEAKIKLKRTAGRQISPGFLHKEHFQELIEHKKMGVTGIYCGKIIKTLRDGFEVSVTKKIHTGDILRLQEYAGDNSSALTVSHISVNGRVVTKASKGEVCFIRCPRPVPENASVYKTGESYPRINNKITALKPLRNKINMNITVASDHFSVRTQICEWVKKYEFSEAKKRPLACEKVADTFKKSNSDSLEAGSITVDIKGDLFIPDSILKSIRREFWDYIHRESSNFNFSGKSEKALADFSVHYRNIIGKKKEKRKKHTHTKCGRDALPVEYFRPGIKEVILPSFCPENRLNQLNNKIEKISEQFPAVKFRITSLYQFSLLEKLKNKHELIISYPSPVCNIFAVSEYERITKAVRHSLIKTQAWIELEKSEFEKLSEHSEITIEIFSGGRVPLMSTRAHIPVTGKIHDDRGAEYLIEKDEISGLTYIYANRALKLPELKNTSSFSTCTEGLTDKITSEFNFNREF